MSKIANQYCADGFDKKHNIDNRIIWYAVYRQFISWRLAASHRRVIPKLLGEDNFQVNQPDPMLDL